MISVSIKLQKQDLLKNTNNQHMRVSDMGVISVILKAKLKRV